MASANERVAADDYPYPLHGSLGERLPRRADQAGAGGDAAASIGDEAVALQNDVKSCRAERLCPPLVSWLAQATTPDVALLRDTLSGWDYRYTTG